MSYIMVLPLKIVYTVTILKDVGKIATIAKIAANERKTRQDWLLFPMTLAPPDTAYIKSAFFR